MMNTDCKRAFHLAYGGRFGHSTRLEVVPCMWISLWTVHYSHLAIALHDCHYSVMAVTAHRNSIATIVRVLMALDGIEHTSVLAAPMGVSQPTVSRRLAGHGAWSTDEIEGLAEFFDVPIATFFMDPADVREAVTHRFPRAITSDSAYAQQPIPWPVDEPAVAVVDFRLEPPQTEAEPAPSQAELAA